LVVRANRALRRRCARHAAFLLLTTTPGRFSSAFVLLRLTCKCSVRGAYYIYLPSHAVCLLTFTNISETTLVCCSPRVAAGGLAPRHCASSRKRWFAAAGTNWTGRRAHRTTAFLLPSAFPRLGGAGGRQDGGGVRESDGQERRSWYVCCPAASGSNGTLRGHHTTLAHQPA